jgi:3-oxoacyl-[acyl-carrier protein] reductase
MKIAIVTGASKGIGKEIKTTLENNGYTVVGTYNKTKAEGLVKCDLSKPEEIKELVKYTLEKYGKIDLVVNCGGVSLCGVVQDISEDEISYLTDVNLKAPYFMAKYVADAMIKNGAGAIINISSIWGNVGASCEVMYSASKGGINTMTKALAKELAPSNIRVNAVAPGVIKTDMLNCYTEEDLKALADETPLGRLGSCEDVAKAVLFLAEADFITGQIITVDGGFSL